MPAYCSTQAIGQNDSDMIDNYTRHVELMRKVYGKDVPLMTRAQWDAACHAPRSVRMLIDDQFDDNYESMRNGDGTIY